MTPLRRLHAAVTTGALTLTLPLTLLAGGSPAAAVLVPQPMPSDWKLVTAVSVSNGSAKYVTATCPPGMQVVGAGGRIVDTGYGSGENGGYGGRVSVVDMVPNAALTTVTVTGGIRDQANWDAAVDTFQVEAQARCARTTATATSPAVVTGLTRVVGASPLSGTTDYAKTATATCGPGLTLYGTGFQLDGANGKVFVNDALPDATLTSVTVAAYNDLLNYSGQAVQVGQVAPVPWSGPWSLNAYAICGTSRGQDVLLQASTVADGFIDKSVQAPQCTPGTVLTGLGVDTEVDPGLAGGPSYVALKKLALAPASAVEDPRYLPSALNRSTVLGSAEFTDLWWTTAYSICH